MDREALLLHMQVDNIVRQHLEFIKSHGREGRSAMADMADFEIRVKAESNYYPLLKKEHFLLKKLVSAIDGELRRMEEKN